jgi:hypothetical protein
MNMVDLIAAGKEFGIFQFYLPFVMLFAIIYGLLQKSKIFGEKGKTINLIIALAASLFVMEYALAAPLEGFFAAYFSQTLAIFVTILGFLMITVLLMSLGHKEGESMFDISKFAKYLVIIGVILAIGAFFSSGGTAIFPGISFGTGQIIPNIPGIDPGTLGIIVIVVLTILAVVYMIRSGGESKEKGEGRTFIEVPKK